MDYREIFESRYNRESWERVLHDIFQSKAVFKATPSAVYVSSSMANHAFLLGTVRLSESEQIAVFEVEVSEGVDVSRNRRSILNMLTPWWRKVYVGAFVLFYKGNEDAYRFSYVSKTWEFDGDGKYVEIATNLKRFTYLFGLKGRRYNTAVQQFEKLRDSSKTLSDITEAFSVEPLSKEFYSRLYGWYQWAMSEAAGVTFPDTITPTDSTSEGLNVKLIRLLTRLLFVWFVKQKKLVPEYLFSASELKNILMNFNKDSMEDGCYYNAILQNLFFATLNCAIVDEEGKRRAFASAIRKRDTKNQYRYEEMFAIRKDEVIELFAKVPFLNGGIFECLDRPKGLYRNMDEYYEYDGFSRNSTKDGSGKYRHRAFIPNKLFFNEDDQQPGILTLLGQYNFTIEENRPDDAEISLDPELLGRVFENLLATYNPETQESARNATGSFYTPRVIVDYMVDESLISYLNSKHIRGISEERLRGLFKKQEKGEEWDKDQVEQITRALKEVKILDPACGSGAFPMGCLLRIVEVIEKLHENTDRYKQKLEIIENCVYGIDIQSIAMLICKLRFFISLICDQENIDFTKPEKNFGVNTLPNLETKFVAANSLISADIRKFDNDWTIDRNLKEYKQELLEIRHNHFLAKGRAAKQRTQQEDVEKRQEIRNYIIENTTKPSEGRIRELESILESNKALLSNYKGEIILTQSKVVEEENLFGEKKTVVVDAGKSRIEEIQRQIQNTEDEIKKEKNKSVPQGFEAAVAQLTEWDPYDQNSQSPFFDAEWMFGVTDGFDIVIGNPPYIQLESNRGSLATFYANCGYKTFTRKGDIYCLFYERGHQLLKDGGHLCFITSNKWMRTGYGEKLRGFFAEETNPKLLIDFAGIRIFESATVDTNILIFAKEENAYGTLCVKTDRRATTGINNLSVFVEQNGTVCEFRNSSLWVILSPIEQRIKRKIESVGTPLKDWDIKIYRGVLTGCDEAFIISTEKRREILNNCKSEAERLRTEELIRPILRGRDIKRYSYDWDNQWLINTHNGVKGRIPRINIDDYPAVKAYLDQFWDEISRRSDQGDTPYNLRNCAYLEDFSKPKIIYQELSQGSCFSIDREGKYMISNTAYLITGENIETVLYFLNSKIIEFAFEAFYGGTLGASGIRWLAQYIINIPIPNITLSKGTPEELEKAIIQLYQLTPEEVELIENQCDI